MSEHDTRNGLAAKAGRALHVLERFSIFAEASQCFDQNCVHSLIRACAN